MPPRHNPTPPPDDGNFIRQIKDALAPDFERTNDLIISTEQNLKKLVSETREEVQIAAVKSSKAVEDVNSIRSHVIDAEDKNEFFRQVVEKDLSDIKSEFSTFKGEFSELKTHVDTGFNTLTNRLDTTNDLLRLAIDAINKLGPKL